MHVIKLFDDTELTFYKLMRARLTAVKHFKMSKPLSKLLVLSCFTYLLSQGCISKGLTCNF